MQIFIKFVTIITILITLHKHIHKRMFGHSRDARVQLEETESKNPVSHFVIFAMKNELLKIAE